MPLQFSKDGYTFRADAGNLTIDPGPKATTLNSAQLDHLSLTIREVYRMPLTGVQGSHGAIDSILAALKEALTRTGGDLDGQGPQAGDSTHWGPRRGDGEAHPGSGRGLPRSTVTPLVLRGFPSTVDMGFCRV